MLAELPNVKDVQEIYINPYNNTFNYIQENSEKAIKTPADMQDFFFILKTESDMGLPIPEWTKNIYPEPTQSIAAQVYAYQNYYPRLRQINSGYMLKKILDDSKSKIDQTSNKKIFLYSGHESTLGYMLNALGVNYEAHVPPYGSAISFELRKSGDQYFIKVISNNR